MKQLSSITFIAFITIITVESCKKPPAVTPGTPSKNNIKVTPKSDTSTILTVNTELVGNWNIVSDTISFEADTMYHGKAADHYIFTKYGNLYIKSALNNYIDTAIYTITNNSVHWINSYWSEGGAIIKGPSQVGAYQIATISDHSLVLTQNILTPEGYKFELIALKK